MRSLDVFKGRTLVELEANIHSTHPATSTLSPRAFYMHTSLVPNPSGTRLYAHVQNAYDGVEVTLKSCVLYDGPEDSLTTISHLPV